MWKKLLIVLLFFVMLSLVIFNNNINTDEGTTDFSKVYMYIDKTQYSSNVDEINVVWKNDTNKELLFGAGFSIEKLDGKEWKSIQNVSAVFVSIGYFLPPHTEMEYSYYVRQLHSGKLEKGTYRIATDYLYTKSSGDNESHILFANFTVE